MPPISHNISRARLRSIFRNHHSQKLCLKSALIEAARGYGAVGMYVAACRPDRRIMCCGTHRAATDCSPGPTCQTSACRVKLVRVVSSCPDDDSDVNYVFVRGLTVERTLITCSLS